ncbi:MAG: hypothetical protein SFY66_00585 [Oculatellaceae cyanobacterium bins.114]|nr:hypothetical protein [Oculatellaceae cyanobacterium bins.114]
MNKTIETNQVIELIRFEVAPQLADSFLESRSQVDEFVKTLNGHIATEITHVNETEWLMLIRWADDVALKAAQVQTASAAVINEWISRHATFISAETLVVKYVA